MTHFGFIMDGNRRWAKRQRVSLQEGYEKGVDVFKEVVSALIELEVASATFFAFSSENWKRPQREIDILHQVVNRFFDEVRDFAAERDVKISFLGKLSDFNEQMQQKMRDIMATSQGKTLHVQIAVSYGGQWDIVQAAQKWHEDVLNHAAPEQLTQEIFEQYLEGSACGPCDCVVRTGGFSRLSNFLLWQMSYADLHFLDSLWPDITAQDVRDVYAKYQSTNRSFGK